jgi:hypothetical protein
MLEASDALGIMVIHGYNTACYHTANSKGGWLREHSEKNHREISAILRAFESKKAK